MALFSIPNPTKKITIDFSLDKIKKGINRIPKYTSNKYKITSFNESFNIYTLESLEFLSLGVFIDINLTIINENKTEINIEVRRKIGTFDQNYEVTQANGHITKLISMLSELIVLSDIDFENKIQNTPVPKSGCFIATATMGDYNHPVVIDLRLFRDNWLLKRQWGNSFTKWYYKHGPKAASIIDKSILLKKLTFIFIIKPLHLITKLFK